MATLASLYVCSITSGITYKYIGYIVDCEETKSRAITFLFLFHSETASSVLSSRFTSKVTERRVGNRLQITHIIVLLGPIEKLNNDTQLPYKFCLHALQRFLASVT